MDTQLPLKSIVLFIACGAFIFIVVFIFAKRQITRFSIKSGRGPHVTIGAGAPKVLKQVIENRLKRVSEISYEPPLLSERQNSRLAELMADGATVSLFYRMKTVDALAVLDTEVKMYDENQKRYPGEKLRGYLVEKHTTLFKEVPLERLHLFADTYEHARHDPAEFGKVQYTQYCELLDELVTCVYEKRKRSTSFSQTSMAACNAESTRNSTVEPAAVQVTYRPSPRKPPIVTGAQQFERSSRSSRSDISADSPGSSQGSVNSNSPSREKEEVRVIYRPKVSGTQAGDIKMHANTKNGSSGNIERVSLKSHDSTPSVETSV